MYNCPTGEKNIGTLNQSGYFHYFAEDLYLNINQYVNLFSLIFYNPMFDPTGLKGKQSVVLLRELMTFPASLKTNNPSNY